MLFLAFAAMLFSKASAQTTGFTRGADVSWCTEMEADGKSFQNSAGEQTELMRLLKDFGFTAVRLRVWVNPSTGHVVLDGTDRGAYGPWCDRADVVAKAKRAKDAGLDVMIDFHYSDFFADPGRQTKPQAWEGLSYAELKTAVAQHTGDVLGALKAEGIEPRWVQIGNETRSGMIWPEGALDWSKSGSAVYEGYVGLTNAGYDAVKAVCPNALVIVHIDKGSDDNAWFFDALRQYGCKFDIIGLSHYPETATWRNQNATLATRIRALGSRFQVPVMVVETGFYQSDETLAQQVMQDLFDKATPLTACAGVFYWEPQLYGWWRPAFYVRAGWNAYGKGAFTSEGKPGKALVPFAAGVNAVSDLRDNRRAASEQNYDLSGRPADPRRGGIAVQRGRKVMR